MKISSETVEKWRGWATEWLIDAGFTPEDMTAGVDAWTVAHRSGIVKDAYSDPTVVDAHIQTALEKIFQNVVFKDKKVY